MIVDSVMTRKVVTIAPRASAREASRLMRAKAIGCLVVVDGGAPLGVVTERDLAFRVLAEGRDPDGTRVADVMSAPVATVDPAASIEEAAMRMKQLGVKRLVVCLDGEVRGLVSATDIAYAEPEIARSFVDGWIKAQWRD
ncbi:MAG TPA: CBS domain-containing protein [Candidatus Thermoplasmatota archaeon]|nr:CBS domain-containing protein [Candidatus Thermoplasmatota archaeon]